MTEDDRFRELSEAVSKSNDTYAKLSTGAKVTVFLLTPIIVLLLIGAFIRGIILSISAGDDRIG